MKKLKDLIEHIFTKKSIKIILTLFIVVFLFVWTSFAQSDWEQTMSLVEEISYLMHIVISILSWWWIILATLAWKFMSNDLVYGAFLNLDSSLWNLWNIMKNLANFALWFILVFTIVKNLFKWWISNEDPIQGAKNTVLSTLVAWVLIQMSRFLIAVMIDLSTIGTAAIWSLPSQFIVADSGFQADISRLAAKVQNRIEIDLSMTGDVTNIIKTWNLNSDTDVDKLVDTIMPWSDTMAWPFIFLWVSVFNLFDLTDSSKNLNNTDDWSDVFLSLWINWFVLFIFSVSLLLIFVFNLFRVITLWVVIPLSPFVFMLFAFTKVWKFSIKLDNFFGQITDIKNIFKLIFMPVYMTLVLSIVLIVMVLMRSVIKADNWNIDLTEHNNMTIESKKIWDGDTASYDSSFDVADIASINLHFKDSLVNVLIYIICLILMVMLVKSCIAKGTWIKFIDDKVSWLSKILWGEKWNFWWLIWTAWVLPLWPSGEKIWIWTAINYVKKAPDRLNRKLEERQQNQDSAIRKALWLDNTSGDFDSLKIIANSGVDREDWLKRAAQIWRNKWYRLTTEFDKDTSFKAAMKYFNDHKVGTVGGVSSEDVVEQMGKEDKEAKKSSENESTEWKTS